MQVICPTCTKTYEHTKINEATIKGDINRHYSTCTDCKAEHTLYYTNIRLRSLISHQSRNFQQARVEEITLMFAELKKEMED